VERAEGKGKTVQAPELIGLRAVFFDAGGTLFRAYPSVGRVYSDVARRHGCRVDPAWVQSRFESQWRRRNGLAHLKNTTERGEKSWWYNLVKSVFDGKMSRARFGDYFDELYDLFGRPDTWRLFPDTLKTLSTLRRLGVRVGIVSNWDSRLFKLCDGLGVTPLVEFILASAVVGYVKPDRGIFRQACALARVRPNEALHIGDSYREDYWGAQQAGLNALLVSRGKDGAAGRSIRRLSDVVKFFN
jgi:putative hydrolase of the HAD superfamily